jgi:hypothetical protein
VANGRALQNPTVNAADSTPKRKRRCKKKEFWANRPLDATATPFMPSSPTTGQLGQAAAQALVETTPKSKQKVLHKGVRVCVRNYLFDGGSPGSFSSSQPQHTHGTISREPEAGIAQTRHDDGTTFPTKVCDLTADFFTGERGGPDISWQRCGPSGTSGTSYSYKNFKSDPVGQNNEAQNCFRIPTGRSRVATPTEENASTKGGCQKECSDIGK